MKINWAKRPVVLLTAIVLGLGSTMGSWGLSAIAAADSVTEIHYSYGNTSGSVWFDWDGAEQNIYWGSDSNYGQSAVASTSPIKPVDSAGPFMQVQLTGLTAGTTYHYKIGAAGLDHTFSTIPTGDFVWGDMGDTTSAGCESWEAQNQSLMAAQNPSFVTHGGDMTYANDCGVQAVHQFYGDIEAWSHSAAFEPVWGNHEYGKPGSEGTMTAPAGTPQDSLLNYKGRSFVTNGQTVPNDTATKTTNPGCGWETGSSANTCLGNDWGWFTAGHVLMVSIPEPWTNALTDWQTKADNLMAAAQADPNVDFIVTYGHRPAYSSAPEDVSSNVTTAVNNLAVKYSPTTSNPSGKYVLNVSHHVHWEEVFKPINGLVNITDGGGGAAQVNPTTFDPNSIYHIAHPAIMRADYSAANHSLTYNLLCGPAYPTPKANCTYGSTLYSQTFTRPNTAPAPAQLGTTLDDNNGNPQVGQQITYTAGVSNGVSGSTAQGVTETVTLPAGESVVNANGGTVNGQTVSWSIGNVAGGAAPVTRQVVVQLTSGNPGDVVTTTATTTATDASCQTTGSVCSATDNETIAVTQGPLVYQWVGNQSVETGINGWTGTYGGSPYVSVSWDGGASHSGLFSIKIAGLTGASNLSSGFNDNPRWVTNTVSGKVYTQSAWVDPTFVGQKITMRLREWHGSTSVTDKLVTLTAATTGWQQMTQTLTAAGSANQLSFAIYGNGINAGQYFYADDFSLTTPN